MSDANSVQIAYVLESIFGEIPSGPPTLQNLRFTSEGLKPTVDTTTSNELRTDRQVADLVRTGFSAGGDINGELSYGTYDDFLEAALLSAAWSSIVTVGPISTISFESIATSSSAFAKVKDSGTGLVGLLVNQWVKLTGSSNAENVVYVKVVSSIAAELEVIVANAGNDFVDESAGSSITAVMGAQILNGTTFKSWVLEKEYTDLSNVFEVLTGHAIDQMSIDVTSDGIVTIAFTFLGKSSDGDNSATIGDGSNTVAGTTVILNGIDHVLSIMANNVAYDSTDFSMQLQNNLRTRLQIGTLGAISIGTGTVDVSGNSNAYFNDQVELNKLRNANDTSYSIIFQDDAGNGYVFDFPRVKYSDGGAVAGGINQDVIAELPFQAIRHATETVTIRIARFAA